MGPKNRIYTAYCLKPHELNFRSLCLKSLGQNKPIGHCGKMEYKYSIEF